ncbi:MAG: DUF116 domain-containing protein [ANME-2 cluster archaeon]|nr:DUF116 domain-containing protein [ANME-2 cluster archaeon]
MVLFDITLNDIFLLIGQLVIVFFLFVIIISAIASALIIYSFRTGHFLFPNFMLSIIIMLEGVVKAIFRLVQMDDSIVDNIAIQLKNRISAGRFSDIPPDKQIIFFPQCLRSIDCPSKLSPEGIQCTNCGRCEIGNAKTQAEKFGYQVFIVPGSSFIRRMVMKYRPEGIIGIGCRFEVKSGLDMCSNIGVVGIGIELEKAGCVATELEWAEFYRVIDAKE